MSLDATAFAADHPRLFAIAYRMVGIAADAEELIQETWIRLQEHDVEPEHLNAYATRVLTHLCIDHMRSARVRRESYVGPWLPEPLRDERASDDPERTLALAESVQVAFLLALEQLGPVERAVFLLREVFDYDYSLISELIGKREDACRQVARRARVRVRATRPNTPIDPDSHAALLAAFFAAAREGDLSALESLLAQDSVLLNDGGGRATAARRPIHGAHRIAQFSIGTARMGTHLRPELATLNGAPSLLLWNGEVLYGVVQFDVCEDVIQAIYITQNPDKLQGLDPKA